MRLLGIDTGARRTGVASFDTEIGIPLAQPTIKHQTVPELIQALLDVIAEKRAHAVVLGLPRLPSGEESDQAEFARSVGEELERQGILVAYVDERYTSPRQITGTRRRLAVVPVSQYDGDAAAACAILSSLSPELLADLSAQLG